MVYRHRFLRSSHLVSLVNGSSQQILRRLQLLYHHGYLERPRAQLTYYHHGGSQHIVYGLGSKGVPILRQEFGNSFRDDRSDERIHSIGRVFLEHALLVSDFMVAVELACRNTSQVRLINQDELTLPAGAVTGPRVFRWNVTIPEGTKLGIIPDRVFALEVSVENGEKDRAYFFLEADRGTMPIKRRDLSQTSMYRKLLAYQSTWTQGIHLTKVGFHRFRVLTVTSSVARAKALVETCSNLTSGQGLFLFTDAKSFHECENILTLRWQTGRLGETASLLE